MDGRNLGRFHLPLAVSATEVEALLMRCLNAPYTRCRPAREMGCKDTQTLQLTVQAAPPLPCRLSLPTRSTMYLHVHINRTLMYTFSVHFVS